MASELRVNTLKDASGNNSVAMSTVAEGSAKSWANFTGTGTIALSDSFNVASLTDVGTGKYDTNFTNSMSNGTFAIHVNSDANTTNDAFNRTAGGSNNTTAKGQARHYESNSLADTALVITTVHGDLA